MGRASFEATKFFERGGVNIAVIGQHFPYTPIANPKYMVEGWSFGIRPEVIQKNINKAKKKELKLLYYYHIMVLMLIKSLHQV